MLPRLHMREQPRKLGHKREQSRVEEILTPSQVAELLQIHVKTVYRLTEEGLIPGNRIGHSWRFRKSHILDLVSNKHRKPPRHEKSSGPKRQQENQNEV